MGPFMRILNMIPSAFPSNQAATRIVQNMADQISVRASSTRCAAVPVRAFNISAAFSKVASATLHGSSVDRPIVSASSLRNHLPGPSPLDSNASILPLANV